MNQEERRRGAAYHGWKVLSGVYSSTAIRADVGSDRWEKNMESDVTMYRKLNRRSLEMKNAF